jgi:hypothetical protein
MNITTYEDFDVRVGRNSLRPVVPGVEIPVLEERLNKFSLMISDGLTAVAANVTPLLILYH